MPHIREYNKTRGAGRHQFTAHEVEIVETIKDGHRTISGNHPNYKYHYQNLYRVRKIGKRGNAIGKIIETPYVYDVE